MCQRIRKNRDLKFSSLAVLFFFAVLLVGVIVYRLYHLQIIRGEEYHEQVSRQYQNIFGRQDTARGDIYFTYHDGNRLLAATDRDYYQLVINNRNVRDPLGLRQVLRTYVEHDRERLEEILKKENDPYEILKPRLSEEEWRNIQENRVPGIELHSVGERYYPLGSLGSMVLGFVSFQGDELVGTYGLEKYYEKILRRESQAQDTSLLFYLFGGNDQEAIQDETAIEKHISKEGSLVTTIEPAVQEYFTRALESVDQQWKSVFTAGIIMNARTGEIVAMADSRSSDHNKNREHYRNSLVEDRYEFGSVMKPLSVAIALDSGSITRDYSYNDTGSMSLNRYTIYNFDKQGRGPYTSLQTILTQSLNTGVADIALKTGVDTFTDYVDQLGLGTETGIDLPYEIYGNTDNIDTGREVELATASFGQGVAVTALEMVRSWGALANGGVMQTPYVVDLIEYGDLIPARNVPAGGNVRVFDPSTTNVISGFLTNIVDDAATFKPYALPNHSVAIKTGTAQIAKPTGGYYEDQFLHSFAGYFPAQSEPEDDRYVVFLFTYKPQGARYSSTTLKDPFFSTVGFMINYFNLPPDRNVSSLENYQ